MPPTTPTNPTNPKKAGAALPISLCVLVKNEADRLPAFFKALQNIPFAEILVADTGSTDASAAIAKAHGAEVLTLPWEGFGATRSALFKRASQPWVLWLDADEILPGSAYDILHAAVHAQPKKPEQSKQTIQPVPAAYALNRYVVFENRHIRCGLWYPDWNVRLFKANAWHMPPRAVHESLHIQGRTKKLPLELAHHSYRNWADLRARSARYAQLWATEHTGKKTANPFTPILRSAWCWVRAFILKRGFLAGTLGLRIANANAAEVYLKYTLLRK